MHSASRGTLLVERQTHTNTYLALPPPPPVLPPYYLRTQFFGPFLLYADERTPKQTSAVSNPYEDFDELHDRDHFNAARVELDCRTPGGLFHFCRPRSGTVYESAKGPGPGFFSEVAPSPAAASGTGRQEQEAGPAGADATATAAAASDVGAASPVGVLSDDHQGCTIS